MKSLGQFDVNGKRCVLEAEDLGFYLFADGEPVATSENARWLANSALASHALEVRWTPEAWAAWEAKS